VISNGIDPDFIRFKKLPKSEADIGLFTILMVGRLSHEKRQSLIIRAAACSKHKHQIKIYLAGQGPLQETYRALAKKLGVAIDIRFYQKHELMDLISSVDLYVHASNIEIEAMSCMEAFAGGLVPVIADSKTSATPQFALNKRCLFTANRALSLTRRIDYWIEHDAERHNLEEEYHNLGKQFELSTCADQLERMMADAFARNKIDLAAVSCEHQDL
jgi:glycosyltransferase involved in cell wall biosynthesis